MTYEWRHLDARELDHERLWLSVALAGAAMIGLGQVASGFELHAPLCPLKFITGIPCPACGGTRAMRALIGHGDVLAALRWNPLATIAAFAALAFLVYAAIVIVFRQPRMRILLAAPDQRLLRVAAWVVILANWAFLIIDGR
jgi:hypothetical protein